MAKTNRRTFVVGAGAALAASASAAPVRAQDAGKPVKKVHWQDGKKPEKTPLFSSVTSATAASSSSRASARTSRATSRPTPSTCSTRSSSKLEEVGSSMEKVVKVNVYLNDLKDYAGMNEVFLGRFGPEPPVRTTIAAAGGIPGNSLVEIDCIATL